MSAPQAVQRVRDMRLRSHRLTAPVATTTAAAEHMLATQAQEFWGGRWALAARTKGEPTLSEVDAAFDDGTLVRSWTARGTIHIIPSRHLHWVLALTGERQFRAAASRHRRLGLGAGELARAEAAITSALTGGNRLSRSEVFELLRGIGIDPRDQRGVHVLYALSVRGAILQGPVVPREGAPSREQYVMMADEWIVDRWTPEEPLTEFFVRYIVSHGPAGTADFAWWAGLPIGMARTAAAGEDPRLTRIDDDLWVASDLPRRHPTAPEVFALPPFEEYYLSYADRSISCAPEHGPAVMTGGVMRPILVARGEIVATWSHSHSLARLNADPSAEQLIRGSMTDVEASGALERYRRFMRG
ncbi:winged helix DNA-binding domain-containing protein [Microbacterium rhizomatis]|uniref:Winged helix DNA-binding domain-containing protein n=1 Tax=Microbacterium rhizomatis TaxID=1631477 RepID=A0A5J5J940_9MICO|nr:winged helix DNA-binding domain-containing protein [Microbacterium rhizomatis]KAA9111303.1 winged helix DNA-binding domain-containing protein [Microbacterium rhizomatis]